MRTAFTLAAFAAGALAVPYKRDVITNYDVVYVTDVVTVTAGQATPTPQVFSHFHHAHAHPHSTTVIEQVSTEAESTYQAPPPSSTPSTSSTPVAEPVTTQQPTSTYVAPTTSSSAAQVYTSTSAAAAAPTSYQDICVYHHNLHRSNHSAPDVAWSDDLASSAQQIAESCVYAHNTYVSLFQYKFGQTLTLV